MSATNFSWVAWLRAWLCVKTFFASALISLSPLTQMALPWVARTASAEP